MHDPQVTVTGYVGTEVEFRSGNGAGHDRATFRLGSTGRFRDRDGQWRDRETVWMTVKAWRGLAQNVAASVRRGEPVVVIGRLQAEKWADDGGQHYRDVLVATTVAHDLNRGTTAFRRNVPPAEPAGVELSGSATVVPFSGRSHEHESTRQHEGVPEAAPV